MDNNRARCIICDELYPQKGLTFFKFPKDEFRLKMWIKAISPLLDILKVSPSVINENGRICAKHFKDKDFINFKKNSLVYNACPTIGVPDLTAGLFKGDGQEILNYNVNQQSEMINPSSQESDIFKCGRCKTEFQVMSAFIAHKRSNCESVVRNPKNTVEENSLVIENLTTDSNKTYLFNFDNKLPFENCSLHTINEAGELVEVVNEANPPEGEMVSFIVSDNGLLIANTPVDLSVLTGQLILTPEMQKESLVLTTNVPQNDGLILSDEAVPVMNSRDMTSDLILTTEVPDVTVPGMINDNELSFTNDSLDIAPSNIDNMTKLRLCEINDQLSGNGNGKENSLLIGLENVQTKPNSGVNAKKTEKTKSKFSCSYCNKIFEKPFNLQQHERVHTGERPFQCIICGRAFSQKANVRKHMIRHKVWPQAKQTLKINVDQDYRPIIDQDTLDRMNYSCQYCSLSFKSYSLHKKHLAVHSDFKVYRCIQKGCPQTFGDLDEFLSHSENHQITEFRCHICLKVFTSLGELGAHQYDHDTVMRDKKEIFNVKLKCDICHAQFKTAESLKNHQAVDSHNYECPQCKSIFNCERFLRRHLATHLDPSESKFECTKCKKTFRTQKYLNNHSFIHAKEKPFNCEHCKKQFASTYRLKRHVAVHLDQFLECPFKTYLGCDKKFYRKDKLRDHVTTHNHFRVRPCSVCSKSYTSLSKLQQHMKRDHGVNRSKQILKCLYCSQVFRKQKQLLQHYCTVGERKFKSRVRNPGEKASKQELVSNIEIIMVPYLTDQTQDAGT